ncbi:hypothetical protein VTK26DRAFT_7616 [Humicola hyalothermophila]
MVKCPQWQGETWTPTGHRPFMPIVARRLETRCRPSVAPLTWSTISPPNSLPVSRPFAGPAACPRPMVRSGSGRRRG